MQRIIIFITLFALTLSSKAQQVQRPKLVVGLMVDQMRWDFLYRYYDRFAANGGFKRMLNQGFTCENTLIPFAPTVTACGHSCAYTGSVPAINGITGNAWWDKEQMRTVYCTEDRSVNTVGSNSLLGKQSPRNLLTTTIADELRLATNFKSKVIGIALKDRGGILPAGHSANAAYWYDNSTGNWITSTYYMNELPGWVNDFNGKKWVDTYYRQGWKLLYPATSYQQSSGDEKAYEAKLFGAKFPYDLTPFTGKDYTKITTTPMGNSLTAEFAKAAVTAEQLGADNITDLIAISFSSTDYVGHSFGPNSVEAEDAMLRLDKDLGLFFDFLDRKVGKNQYTVFLSADHGVAHIPEFMQENKLPGGRVMTNTLLVTLNKELDALYKIKTVIVSDDNYQLHLNHPLLDSANIDQKDLTRKLIRRLQHEPGIDRVFAIDDLNSTPLPAALRTRLNNGYHPKRSGDIQLIFKPGYIDAWNNTGTTHGLWNPYDSHIPLLWYGWGINKGKTNRETSMTDIAATLAALLHVQVPNGNVGHVIEEVLK